jgi:hypothetical protein
MHTNSAGARRAMPGTRLDAAGVVLSALCGVHCVALPLFGAAGVALSGAAGADYAHYVLFALAAPVTALAAWRSLRHRHSPWLLGLAGAGLAALWFGLSRDSHELAPTLMTLSGATLLAVYHLQHWRLHRAAHDANGVPAVAAGEGG